jgi:hypothetical protein
VATFRQPPPLSPATSDNLTILILNVDRESDVAPVHRQAAGRSGPPNQMKQKVAKKEDMTASDDANGGIASQFLRKKLGRKPERNNR